MSITGLRWAGPRAVLVELDNLASVLALHHRLQAEPLPGQVDAIAGAATVLVRFASRFHTGAARELIPHLDLAVRGRAAGSEVTIEVVYDGEDLAEVGRLTGLGADGVVAAHTGQVWTGAFGGFAPGFTYLVGENDLLHVPRRSSPRTAVPAGSVALGGAFSAVYPRQSPGGWQLLGHTGAVMWDLDREPPALVRPGDTVRYVAVRESVVVQPARDTSERTAEQTRPAGVSGLVVEANGLQSLVQDLGRPGFGDLGVSVSGAADHRSTRQANRLVGNQPGAAVVENLLGGLAVRAQEDQVLAVAGAHAPLEIRDGARTLLRRPAMFAPFALLDGETLTIGAPDTGVRSYLAVRGGVDVAPVLGSRSSDSMSGIGPAPLSAGMFLPVAPVSGVHPVGIPEDGIAGAGTTTILRVTLGPRDDWFDAEGIRLLSGQQWRVTEQSNRIGVRLAPPAEGTALHRTREGELPSEGAVAGALQVPPNGHPVLFLADHPVTGGYPVIAVVVPEDLPAAAQLPPGQQVAFTVVNPRTLARLNQDNLLEFGGSSTAPEGSQP
ncbi:5-oxoprolinase/urea amidolyase family protein [Pseudarthrobacter sp. NamE2]|uniref:5-oxoprolinase subunit B/C family protein n=1 Tax=Pseudarthrobacter sp. NamE2 TaxID=2576838 RepID=UPI0010FEDA88|nr:5-oxoprolinase/urea amidolyase family protein [Pseudarthrobacter sp. NamE2]TLM83007.1 5-oxoprolinase/urea amidolyase family protein [Pseudarthrobacter sp. NamE2]